MAADEQQQRRGRGAALQHAQEEFLSLACECSDQTCREVVSLTREELDFIRKVPDRLIVRPGHGDPEAERVVMAEPGRFEVVERFGPRS